MRRLVIHGHIVLCGDSQQHPGFRDIAIVGTTLALMGVFPDLEDDVAAVFVEQHLDEIREQLLRTPRNNRA